MKRWQTGILLSLVVLAALIAIAITVTIGWRPIIGPRARALTDRRFEATPARLARGEYVVRNVAACLFCHSELDTSVRGLPIKEGEAGGGRTVAAEDLPWLVASNISSDPQTGAGAWTDDMLARAIREGIGHDGRALFPFMPYPNYRQMSDEDLASVIVYIRSLPPIRRALPQTEIPFPPGPLINAVPQPLTQPVAAPDASTPERKGEYLTRLASCTECHTPRDAQGASIAGLEFAGGNIVRYIGARPDRAAPNLTPAPSGIPYYTDELFLEVMRTGRVREREVSDLMPWGHYGGMTDDDLKAIFAYLKTRPPVDHSVDNTLSPTPCARCGIQHGGGDRNKPL